MSTYLNGCDPPLHRHKVVEMKQSFKASGMHCSACEKLLQMEIGGLKGVKSVKANAVKGTVEVEGEGGD